MLDGLVDQILAPVGRRIGTALSGLTAGWGIEAGQVNAAQGAIVVLLGFAVDVGFAYFRHRSRK